MARVGVAFDQRRARSPLAWRARDGSWTSLISARCAVTERVVCGDAERGQSVGLRPLFADAGIQAGTSTPRGSSRSAPRMIRAVDTFEANASRRLGTFTSAPVSGDGGGDSGWSWRRLAVRRSASKRWRGRRPPVARSPKHTPSARALRGWMTLRAYVCVRRVDGEREIVRRGEARGRIVETAGR